MRLNRSSGYALTAAVKLAAAKNGEILSCSKMCEGTKIPEKYLLQLLNHMTKAGLVKSTRGRDGGYQLGKPAAKITFADIVAAVEGPIVGESVDVAGLSSASVKIIDKAMATMAGDAKKRLAAISLADLKLSK